MARDKWHSRDKPILEAIATVLDTGDPVASVEEIIEATDLSDDEVRTGLRELYESDYITGMIPARTFGMQAVFYIEGIRLLERGREETGVWPATDAYDGLLAALDARLATSSGEERGALEQLRKSVVTVGESVIGALATDFFRRLRDGL